MKALEGLGSLIIPVMLLLVPLHGALRKVKVLDAFVRGAEGGLRMVLRMAPYMIAMFAALASVRESGLVEAAAGWLSTPAARFGVVPETLAQALVRPISGSGSMAICTEILKRCGPDSFLGMLSSTVQGSTDTTFYVVAAYFGSVGITRTRHALLSGLIGDACGIAVAVMLANLMFK
ncbi:MAG: spore maturation protein [Bacillota bacterium]|nr:spore maturation protein [Bacillota bacterium]